MSEVRKGMLLVISGPSGTGKGTLIERLMQEDPTVLFHSPPGVLFTFPSQYYTLSVTE